MKLFHRIYSYTTASDLGISLCLYKDIGNGYAVIFRDMYWGFLPYNTSGLLGAMRKEAPLLEAWHGIEDPIIWS